MRQWHLSSLWRSRFFPQMSLGLMLGLILTLGSWASVHPAFASGGGGSGSGGYDSFVQTTTTANTAGSFTYLDDSLTNNNPNAVIMVTANWNPNGVYTGIDNHLVGVMYITAYVPWKGIEGTWAIFNEDGSPMPIGVSFNVIVSQNQGNGAYVLTATSANTSGYIMYINEPDLNDNPAASFQVTQNGGMSGIIGGGETTIITRLVYGTIHRLGSGPSTTRIAVRSPTELHSTFNTQVISRRWQPRRIPPVIRPVFNWASL
ncbi:MAG TPA: hypothetical protein VKX46_20795 [Ktedonobacteraceae bacterium]|nr:hypothetical protein [Ktedonobacteraceae bacterium]